MENEQKTPTKDEILWDIVKVAIKNGITLKDFKDAYLKELTK